VRIPRFGLFLAAVFAAKLVVVLQLRDHPLLQPDAGLDAAVYARLAAEAIAGNVWLGPGLYIVSPLYTYVVAGILGAGGTFSAVRVLQIALGTAAVALVFAAAREWFGRRAAWMAAIAAALTGLFTFHEAVLWESALDPFLTAWALATLAFALRRAGLQARRSDGLETRPSLRDVWSDGWRFTAAGAVLGILALNRPAAWLPAASVALLLAALRRWKPAAATAIGLLMALSPLLVRDAVVSRDWSPLSSHGGLNFYIGNNPEADGTYRNVPGISGDIAERRDEARRVAEASVGRALDDGEVSAYFYGLGWSWMRLHTGDAASLFARKLRYMFNAASIAANTSYAFYAYDMRTLLAALFVGPWLLLPLGLAGLVLGAITTDRRADFLIWASFVPMYAVSVAIFYVSERYRLPMLLPLCIGAGHLVDRLVFFRMQGAGRRNFRLPASAEATAGHRSVPRRWRAEGLALALSIALAHLTNLPAKADDGRAEERTRMAEALVKRDEIEAAEAWVKKAEPGYPMPGALHFRVGRVLLLHGRPEAALSHFERALAIAPGSAEVEYAAGQALVDAKRYEEAIPRLQNALRAGVRVDLAGYDLARARAGAGDRAGALQTLQSVRPDSPNDATSYTILGQLAMQLESPSLAAAFFAEAVRASPRTSRPHQDLGLALAMMGRYQEAIAQFEQGIALDPRDPAAHLNLAVAYAETGRSEEARARAQEALRLNPNYDRARQFLKALR
jgi:tetratricopeptide (TPR) repeat protein